MTTPVTIPKDNTDIHQSEDYAFLRAEGLAYIEQLASKVWTDYNVHDPGITLLEALCYAITDLGYRTSFDMKDLLAKPDKDYAASVPPLFTARNILTNNPLTVTDLRKMLVDKQGIRNAWLEIADCQEVDFFAECENSTLQYFGSDHKIDRDKLKVGTSDSVLQTILNDPDQLEKQAMPYPIALKAYDAVQDSEVTRQVEIPLPGWQEISNRFTTFCDFINLDTITSIALTDIRFDNPANRWQADIRVYYELEGNTQILILNDVVVEDVPDLSTQSALETYLSTLQPGHPVVRYQQKLHKTLALLTEHSIRLRGLYNVLLEYEVDDRFGDLNSPLLYYTLVIINEEGETENVRLEIVTPSWNSIYDHIEQYEPFLNAPSFTYQLSNSFADSNNKRFTTDITFEYDDDGSPASFTWENIVFKGIALQSELEKDLNGILTFWRGKLQRLLEITRGVEHCLHEYRNLCEDYKKISSICVNEIGICADILLANDASLIQTQADILFQIQQYISPSIRFYSLQEMVDRGVPTEEIFNGPRLDHGFILDEEIEASDLSDKRFIYASDIINIIQDVPGVIAVKDLLLTKYDKRGRPVLPSERWCVRIDAQHKAELSISKSKLLFFKDDLPYVLSGDKYQRMLRELDKLRALHERHKLLQSERDFPVPEGTPLDLDEYTPLRFVLPQTYGIGVTGLPEPATTERAGKAKQLQAFLALFDQLLANYLSQLANIDQLFSADRQVAPKLKKTYYNNFLNENQLGADLYVDALVLEDAGGAGIGQDSLQRLTESHADYLDRRNRFLDHLLARFAENFTEYALLVFSTTDDDTQQELIYDKTGFLESYPTISSQRGKAFNYKDEAALWNSDNVVGLKKRVSKLLGMESFLRQNYHCPTVRDEFKLIEDSGAWTYQLSWGTEVILTSPKSFTSDEEAFYSRETAIELAADLSNYTTKEAGSEFIIQIGELDPNDPLNHDIYLESTATYLDVPEAMTAAAGLRDDIRRDFSRSPVYTDLLETDGADYFFQFINRNQVILDSPKVYGSEAEALEGKRTARQLALDIANYTTSPAGAQYIFQIGVLDEIDPLNNEIFYESTEQYDTEAAAMAAAAEWQRTIRAACLSCSYFDLLIEDLSGNFRFFLRRGTTPVLMAADTYATKDETLRAAEQTLRYAYEWDNYTTEEPNSNEFIFQLGDIERDEADGAVLSKKILADGEEIYNTDALARQAAGELQRQIAGTLPCDIEGMHIIEHLLLRPKQEHEDRFFEVCLGDDCFFCGEEDPYSFRASVVFPYWTGKFSHDDPKLRKRQYVERLLRREAPAHVHLKICWIDNRQMRLLELHYRRWLEENARRYPDQDMLTGRLNALIDILGELRNRYPEGFLHDCDDSEEENTIILGKSFIGSYNPPEE